MSHWIKKCISQIGTVVSGATPSTGIQKYWDGSINWITPNDLSKLNFPFLLESERKISDKGLESCSAHLVPAGNLVLSSRAPIGYFAIPLVDFTTNQGCKSIIFKDNQHSLFHYYNFEFLVNRFKEKGEGTTFAEISKKSIESLEFLVPNDFEEQIAISRVVHTIDKAAFQTQHLIAKYERIKIGLMQDLLTRGIDEDGNIRSEETHELKDSPLGRIPKEWDIFPLSHLGSIVTGSTPSTKNAKYYGDKFQFIAPVDVTENVYINRTEKGLSELGFSICRQLPPESICVVCIGSTIGKIGITKVQAATNQQINTLVPSNIEWSNFIYYSLMSHLPQQLRKVMGLQAVPIVNKSTFAKMVTALPGSNEEIKNISSVLDGIQDVIENKKLELSFYKSIKTGLMQDLLTGKVRVNALMKQTAELV